MTRVNLRDRNCEPGIGVGDVADQAAASSRQSRHPEDAPVLREVSYINIARWALSGVNKTADTATLILCDETATATTDCRDSWNRKTTTALGNALMLVIIAGTAAWDTVRRE